MIYIARVITEETKQKRLLGFYNKAIDKAKTEIGKTYNKLTILDIDYDKSYDSYFNQPYHNVYVITKCQCGKISSISSSLSSIISGHTKSCGCSKFNNPLNVKDLTGMKFNRLTVIRRDIERDKQMTKKGNAHWICKCDCGNTKTISVVGYQLTGGYTQSCGCYASEQIAKRNKQYSTKYNDYYELDKGIVLVNGQHQCIIDKEDYEIVKNWYWRKVDKRGDINKGYWISNVKQDDKYNKHTIMIHQVIAEIKYGEYDTKVLMPDHLSRNTDDNRKCNIILKSNESNCKNRSLSKSNQSGKTGVSYNKQRKLWNAYITVDYKQLYLGGYENIDDAINARLQAEKEYGFTCDNITPSYDIAYK